MIKALILLLFCSMVAMLIMGVRSRADDENTWNRIIYIILGLAMVLWIVCYWQLGVMGWR